MDFRKEPYKISNSHYKAKKSHLYSPIIIFFIVSATNTISYASEVGWTDAVNGYYSTSYEACAKKAQTWEVPFYLKLDPSSIKATTPDIYSRSPYIANCSWIWRVEHDTPIYDQWGNVIPNIEKGSWMVGFTGSCPTDQRFDLYTGLCTSKDKPLTSKTIGNPDDTPGCDGISPAQGNPINAATGNKYQDEIDYEDKSFSFHRYYNGAAKKWSYTYSTVLSIGTGEAFLVRSDGRALRFTISENYSAVAEDADAGTLLYKPDHWEYIDRDGGEFHYSLNGALISFKPLRGKTQQITAERNKKIVSDGDRTLEFEYDDIGLRTFKSGELEAKYNYDDIGRLISVSKSYNTDISSRLYHYEDAQNPYALTGITDERGVRFASWSYDSAGRAISSEHAGGTGQVLLAYNTDGSTTVTNSFGKTSTYNYKIILGIPRVESIQGDPSSNCKATNSQYSYDAQGRLIKKTDNEGLETYYSYNDRGLETSRTDAAGTPLATTTYTEWDPIKPLPLSIKQGGSITSYIYDNQGRVTSESVQSSMVEPPPVVVDPSNPECPTCVPQPPDPNIPR